MSDAQQIGQRLRAAREALDLSISQVEQRTRIRARFLEALEAGDYSSMTQVQAQGFLRNYARFLGLDIELLLSEIEDDKGPFRRRRRGELPISAANNAPAAGPTPQRPPRRQRPMRRSRGVLGNIMIVIVAGAIVVALVLGGYTLADRWSTSETQPVTSDPITPALTSPSVDADASGTAGTGEETQPPQPTDPAAAGDSATTPPDSDQPDYTPPPLTGTSVSVTIEIVQTTWIRVMTDGEVRYEGVADAGEILNYVGESSVNVRANNAAGLRLTVNNQPQGVLGERGQLFDQTFTLDGAAPPAGAALEQTGSDTLATPAAALPASPTEATFLLPTATIPLDPGDGSLFDAMSQTPPGTATFTPIPLQPDNSATPTIATGDTSAVTDATLTAVIATATHTATATATHTATHTATMTTTPTATGTVTPAPTATLTATPSLTPTPTATSTATPSLTPSRTPTLTPTPSYTPTATYTWTPSPTWSPTPSFTPSQTPFLPPRETRTPSPVPK